jgi:[acyl-carrier-protein] S-malonyltransferase
VRAVLVFEGQGTAAVPLDPATRSLLDAAGVDAGTSAPLLPTAAAPPEVVQPALVAAQLARVRRAAAVGVEPQAVLGHSLGELPAAVVAGSLSADDAVRLARLRASLPAQLLPDRRWAMVALTRIDADAVSSAVTDHDACVACYNSPSDVVLSGPEAGVRQAVAALGGTDRTARVLPVVAPYHTPWMTPVADAVAEVVSGLRIADPRIPIVSPTSSTVLTAATEVAALIVEMLVAAVRWPAALALATAEHPALPFVDCGPGGVLARYLSKNGLHELAWASVDDLDEGRPITEGVA